MATINQTQAGQIGVLIKFNQLTGGPSFTNSECTMIVDDPTGKRATYECQNSTDGTYAFYVTTGTEFVVEGPHRLQLIYTFEGDLFKSAVQTMQVLSNL